MPRDGVPGARSGPRPRCAALRPCAALPLVAEHAHRCVLGCGLFVRTTPESREPAFRTSLQRMSALPGRTAEALATRLGFRFRLAGSFHDPQAGVAHFTGILPILVIDAPMRPGLPVLVGRLHAHAMTATLSGNANGFPSANSSARLQSRLLTVTLESMPRSARTERSSPRRSRWPSDRNLTRSGKLASSDATGLDGGGIFGVVVGEPVRRRGVRCPASRRLPVNL